MIEPETPLLLTSVDAARALACSEDTLRRLVAAGQIPTVRIGQRLVRIPAAALTEYVERQSEASR